MTLDSQMDPLHRRLTGAEQAVSTLTQQLTQATAKIRDLETLPVSMGRYIDFDGEIHTLREAFDAHDDETEKWIVATHRLRGWLDQATKLLRSVKEQYFPSAVVGPVAEFLSLVPIFDSVDLRIPPSWRAAQVVAGEKLPTAEELQAEIERLRVACADHQRVRENHCAANREAQAECAVLRAENERLYQVLVAAYLQRNGSDASHGVRVCDAFKEWLANLLPGAPKDTP